MLSFIYDFLYYNFISSGLALSCFVSLEYIIDPNNFKNNMSNYINNTLFFIVDRMLEYKILYDDNIEPFIERVNNGIFVSKEKETRNIVLNNDIYFYKTNNTHKEHFYVMKNEDNNNIVKKSKPLISFEVSFINPSDEKEIVDISRDLERFYYVDNIINDQLIQYILLRNNNNNKSNSKLEKCYLEYNYIDSDCNTHNSDSINIKILENDKYLIL